MTTTTGPDVGTRRPRIPAGLIGALALIAAAEAAVARLDDDHFTTIGAASWSYASGSARKLAAEGAPGPGVVGFGDSLVKFGLMPAVLRERLGRPAWNLAMPWGQPFGHDVLLRRLLEGGARPEALVVDGELLDEDPTLRPTVWPWLIDLPECVELAWGAGDARLLGELAAARLLPSVRARADIRAYARALARRSRPPDVAALPVNRVNWRRNFGAEPLAVSARPPVVDAEIASIPGPGGWSCHPANAVFVDRFLARAGANGIPVFWVLPPVHPAVQAVRDRNGRDAAYGAFIRDLAARYPHLVVLDARNAGYPASALADATHLNRDGAAAFSAAVADALAAHLGGPKTPAAPRWVDLARWDPALPGRVREAVALEHVGETVEAVARR